MQPSDRVRLQHMLDAAREAISIATGCNAALVQGDRVLTLALVKCIEIVGEAASKVSPETRAAHKGIPWQDIIGMRNRLIHAYFDIDFDRVRDTIETDLPALIAMLTHVLTSGSA